MSALEQRIVSVDGVRTFYRSRPGAGRPVLFVHGSPTSSEDWVPFMERLDRRAVALDLPGWGATERRSTAELDHSMQGLARFVEREALKLAVQWPALTGPRDKPLVSVVVAVLAAAAEGAGA